MKDLEAIFFPKFYSFHKILWNEVNGIVSRNIYCLAGFDIRVWEAFILLGPPKVRP